LIYVQQLLLFILIALSSGCSLDNRSDKQMTTAPESTLLKHLFYLSSDDLEGRRVGTQGGQLAQNYIVSQLQDYGIKPLGNTYLAPFTISGLFKDIQGSNVIGVIPGSKFPDQFIVLSAHYDHIGGRNSKIFNGADDNASGTAALLEFGKRLQQSPLRFSVILLFTDAEEVNLKGAKAFIAQNSSLLANIVLNVNLDMIGGSATTKHLRYISRGLEQLVGTDTVLALKQQESTVSLKKGFRQQSGRESTNINWKLASDHGVFFRENIPFIYYGVGVHKNYHQITDTYQNINQQFFINAANAIYQQLIFIEQNL
jgi:Zn-dependent M28 family amino/carboxypeptidase